MDNEKDVFIKQRLQKDKLISKKAEDLFSKLNTGEIIKQTNDEDIKNTITTNAKIVNNINRFTKLKRLLATAASFVIVTGAANVYATYKGYQNIFFMIKYLITGEQQIITQRDEILSDKDITISFEQINITKGLSISVRKLQILDNKAKLFISTSENDIIDTSIFPLLFKVYNSKNILLCESTSTREEQNSKYYTDELILNNFTKNDKILNLEIYKSNSKKIATLIINLDERKVEVLGEKEALQKISEIELKKFLGTVADEVKPNSKLGKGECINISNISYSDGVYIVNYSFFYKKEKDEINFNIDNYDIYEQVVYIALNTEKSDSKFKLVDKEEPMVLKEANKNENNTTSDDKQNVTNKNLNNNTTNNTKKQNSSKENKNKTNN